MGHTYIEGMLGLGDNIFQRPLVRELTLQQPVLISTPWPQLYHDLPRVGFVQCYTGLRTQSKNIEIVSKQVPMALRSVAEGSATARIRLQYGHHTLNQEGITTTLRKLCGIPLGTRLKFDLPPKSPYTKRLVELPQAPYIVVRPVTQRSEWSNPARNPLPQYIDWFARQLKGDFIIFSVADVDNEEERFVGAPPYHDRAFHGGELDPDSLIHLVRNSAGCIGGVGWIVPMALAANRPLLCVLGGMGLHNAPDKITDPSMDTSRVTWAVPDNFCMCDSMNHHCNKQISDLGRSLDGFREQINKN